MQPQDGGRLLPSVGIMNRRAGARHALVGVALLAAGCGALEVGLPGRLQHGLVDVAASTSATPVLLGLDSLGNLTINGRVLDVPSATERRRFGVTAFELAALPPAWRPRHGPGGGVLVGALARTSPLALAGLRPLDVIVAADGQPVATPNDLVDRLRDAADVRLDVVTVDGRATTIAARAGDLVDEVERIYVPFLFDARESCTGASFGFGPLDALFWFCERVEVALVDAPGDPVTYVRRDAWGALANLIGHDVERDLRTGATRTWLILFAWRVLLREEDAP